MDGYTRSMAKVMVSFSDDLLAEIDAEAARRSTSRSALLATAARRELARRHPDDVRAAIERSEQRFRTAGSFEAASLIRADRDSRR
jgi:metal-responsive CopG/Arc/MetJ family transcriptional regulator